MLHVRKAMHKIFAYTPLLKQVPALIFHSYSGTLEDAQALLKRGLNAYFSFGNSILLNHKAAQRACAAVPLTRLLSETDSPYQPLHGNRYSSWQDLPLVLRMMADLRAQAAVPQEIERIIEENFFAAFHKTTRNRGYNG
ncbi:hypothetical protein FACS1894200_09510 [Spirochaetia bacterium]|nr:hypothetical protein FACS1894200_09510 [Spirochaetia bacterium]